LAFFSGASQFQHPYGTIAAAAVVVTVPVVVLVLLFQRRIVSGLTSGAVKG
jgi:multiple sugar transport system permease protein